MNGTAKRPRLVVYRSNKYIYTQVYNDDNNQVIASASTLEKEVQDKLKSTKDKEAAKMVGKLIAERLKKKKIKSILFDRNTYAFAGRVKALAEATRENGIKF
jgi:large subunit ribosomal protein L18